MSRSEAEDRAAGVRWSRREFLGALAGACAAACARGGDAALRFWAMGREGEVATELLRDFERETGLRVRVEGLPWSAAHEKLLTAFAGEATPDVAQMGNTWLPEFVALGALEPLDARLGGSRDVALDDYDPGILETNAVDGRRYGLPWYVDTRVLFYRRDLLAEVGHPGPPRDWEDWTRAMEALVRRPGPERYAILLPLNEYEPFVALWLQQGEPLLRDDGRYGNFRSDGFARTLRFYLSLYERRLAPPVSSQAIANVWTEFGRGLFSFYVSGPWQMGEFARRLPPALQDSWMTAPLPGPAGPGASIAGGSSLAVFRRSHRKEEAWKLVEYLSRTEVQRRFYRLTGNLPARRSAWSDPVLAGDPRARAFREQLTRVRPVPKVPEWERIATELRLALEKAVRGELAPGAVAEELDRRADAILAKRRWLLARRAAR